jgi:hypothetical protein
MVENLNLEQQGVAGGTEGGTDDGGGQTPQHIPYDRFKEVNDKYKSRDTEYNELNTRYGELDHNYRGISAGFQRVVDALGRSNPDVLKKLADDGLLQKDAVDSYLQEIGSAKKQAVAEGDSQAVSEISALQAELREMKQMLSAQSEYTSKQQGKEIDDKIEKSFEALYGGSPNKDKLTEIDKADVLNAVTNELSRMWFDPRRSPNQPFDVERLVKDLYPKAEKHILDRQSRYFGQYQTLNQKKQADTTKLPEQQIQDRSGDDDNDTRFETTEQTIRRYAKQFDASQV